MPTNAVGRLARMLGSLFAIALVALVAACILPRFFGYTPYTVLSGSMEPQLPVGSLIYVHATDATQLAPGDVITFHRSDGAVVTHQIYEVNAAEQTVGTQGIANVGSDGSITHDAEATPFSQIIGTPVLCVPYLGYVNAYCTTPPGLYIVVAIAVLLLVASALAGTGDAGRPRKHAQTHVVADAHAGKGKEPTAGTRR